MDTQLAGAVISAARELLKQIERQELEWVLPQEIEELHTRLEQYDAAQGHDRDSIRQRLGVEVDEQGRVTNYEGKEG